MGIFKGPMRVTSLRIAPFASSRGNLIITFASSSHQTKPSHPDKHQRLVRRNLRIELGIIRYCPRWRWPAAGGSTRRFDADSMAPQNNSGAQLAAATAAVADDFDWTTWDQLPFDDSPPPGLPPDPKRGKWGGPCAGPGKDGKGCHQRWASVWYGKKGFPQFCKESACHARWAVLRDREKEAKAEAGLSQGERLRKERKEKRAHDEIEPESAPIRTGLASAATTPISPALSTPLQSSAASTCGVWEPVQFECILGQRCAACQHILYVYSFLCTHPIYEHEHTSTHPFLCMWMCRWREPRGMEPWQRRNFDEFKTGYGMDFILFGNFSEQPDKDIKGSPDVSASAQPNSTRMLCLPAWCSMNVGQLESANQRSSSQGRWLAETNESQMKLDDKYLTATKCKKQAVLRPS